jgi:outer membrane protein assembly factor BamB
VRPLRLAVVVLIVAAGAGGCDWAHLNGNAGATRSNPFEPASSASTAPTLARDWSLTIGPHQANSPSNPTEVLATSRRVFVAARGTFAPPAGPFVEALRPSDGAQLWRRDVVVDGANPRLIAAQHDLLLVLSARHLIALRQDTGEVAYDKVVATSSARQVSVDGDDVFVGSGDFARPGGTLERRDFATGAVLDSAVFASWVPTVAVTSVTIDGRSRRVVVTGERPLIDAATLDVLSTPSVPWNVVAVEGATAYTVDLADAAGAHELHSYDLETATNRWTYLVDRHRVGSAFDTRAVGNGLIAETITDQLDDESYTRTTLHVIDATSGVHRWHKDVLLVDQPQVMMAGGVVYVTTNHEISDEPAVQVPAHIAAYDATNGDLLWTSDETYLAAETPPALSFAYGALYVNDGETLARYSRR